MPATSTPNPDDMIDSIMKSNHASEVELGVLICEFSERIGKTVKSR